MLRGVVPHSRGPAREGTRTSPRVCVGRRERLLGVAAPSPGWGLHGPGPTLRAGCPALQPGMAGPVGKTEVQAWPPTPQGLPGQRCPNHGSHHHCTLLSQKHCRFLVVPRPCVWVGRKGLQEAPWAPGFSGHAWGHTRGPPSSVRGVERVWTGLAPSLGAGDGQQFTSCLRASVCPCVKAQKGTGTGRGVRGQPSPRSLGLGLQAGQGGSREVWAPPLLSIWASMRGGI